MIYFTQIYLQSDSPSAVSKLAPILCLHLFKPLFARVPAYNLGEYDEKGDDGGDGHIPFFDPDDTLNLLVEMGLINLLGHPTIVGLFTGYLALLGNITAFLNLNLESLDPGTLVGLLHNLKPIMTYNELFLQLLKSVWHMFEVYDLNIDYVPEEF